MPEFAKSPYPYFGGKSSIAGEVWTRLGDVSNFVDPFMGSNAMLLARPEWDWERGTWRDGKTRLETVNDMDAMIPNLWRAIDADPEAVAHYADWITSECDLTARHIWLVQRRESLTERLMGDPEFYDAKAAGWWLWGICCWIGGGWCSGEGPWTAVDGKLVHLGNAGQGVNRQLVHLGNAGQGVNKKLVHLCHQGQGIHQAARAGGIYDWMRALSERLRRVRVCCGDWSRVCGPTPTVLQGLTGVFLDPPYGEGRRENLYAHDSLAVAEDVRRWALEWGDDPRIRIALCGYEPLEMSEGWTALRWKARGGYGSQGNGAARENSRREMVWFSPHCLADKRASQEVLPL